MGTNVPNEEPNGKLSSALWAAINAFKSDYNPFSITVNLGYTGQGGSYPVRFTELIPEDQSSAVSMETIGIINEETLFDLEVFALSKDADEDDTDGYEAYDVNDMNDLFKEVKATRIFKVLI